MSLKAFLLVFLGGGLGSAFRYLLSLYFQESTYLQTLLPNLIGCFLLGIFTQVLISEHETLKLMLVFGVLGGLTTFSGYVGFIGQSGFYTPEAIKYFLMNNLLGIAVFVLGAQGAKWAVRAA